MITVALPVWKSKDIAWLCMESLCRQKPVDEWELLIFEEVHKEALGQKFFHSYSDRLKETGCKRVEYQTSMEKYPLSMKWVMIARQSDKNSEAFCLCAADNYYDPHMLQDAERNIKKADWCITPKGYFYDFQTERVLRYDFATIVGLQMTAKTRLVRQFPMEEVNKGVDTWFARKLGLKGSIFLDNYWQGILCTQGLNNISHERCKYFDDPQHPFYSTRKKLINIVPVDIYHRLTTLTRCLKLQSL